MKRRATRNTKPPARFADMIPYDEFILSENEPPISRRRLLDDSGPIEDDIQQLESLADSKTRIHKTTNNIPPLQLTTPSKKSPNDDDLFVIRRNIQDIIRQLQDMPKRITDQLGSIIKDEVRRVNKAAALAQNVKVPCKPICLPFKTAEDIKKFDRLPNEEYDNVVKYLSHVGGCTARSCANAMLKEAANDEVFHNFTFTGHKGKNVFKDLRFAKACEEAMAANQNFTLTQAVFKKAITEALRSSKQRFQNRQDVLQVENNSGNSRDGSDETDDNASNSENELVYN
ncbi:uncharacterized protein [Temnothorax nylanderi]|uniref:uncharacterized protein n=1 Tax=Temnothorax nylanderi TaxID=102681 RepID=UPI003A8A4E47